MEEHALVENNLCVPKEQDFLIQYGPNGVHTSQQVVTLVISTAHPGPLNSPAQSPVHTGAGAGTGTGWGTGAGRGNGAGTAPAQGNL